MGNDNKQIRWTFNPLRFVALCLKNWLVFAACAILFGGLAALYTIVKPQQDEVFAQLMLKEDNAGGSSMFMAGQIARSFSLGDMFGGSSTTDNEAMVLQSHAVFLGTVRDLGLNVSYSESKYGIIKRDLPLESPVRLIAPPEMADTISVGLLFKLKRHENNTFDITVKLKRKTLAELKGQSLPTNVETSYGTFLIEPTKYLESTKANKLKIFYTSYDGAADAYADAVDIFVPDRKTDFIDLSYRCSDPEFGKMLLNAIIDNYVQVSNLYKQNRTEQSLRLVDDRLSTLSGELIKSEGDIEKFKKDNKLTDVEVDAQYLMTKTGSLEGALLQAQTNYEIVKMTKDFISNPENNYSLIPDILTSSAATTEAGTPTGLIGQYNTLILERMQLLASAKGTNSSVKMLDQQIDALRSNILASVDRAYQNATVTLRDIKGEEGRTKSRISELPAIERNYLVLKRDNLLQEQIYLFLLQQREEIMMNLASRSLPAQTIDTPHVLSNPSGLTRTKAIILGILLGLIVATAYVFIIVMKRTPVHASNEIFGIIKAPALHGLAQDKNADRVELSAGVNANSLRQLRADVQAALKQCNGKVVSVTSSNASEGKTYVSANLAASLAVLGKRVLLVDASLRNPAAASLLGVANPTGALTEYVLSNRGIDSINITTVDVDGSQIDIIPSVQTVINATDIIASDRFAELIDSVKTGYDYIVIDSPQVKGYSDINYITAVSDITLVVCRAKVVSTNDIDMLNQIYDDGRLKRMAVVLNGFK